MASVSVEYVDTNLISGSEPLRTQLEQSWEYVSSSEGVTLSFNGNVDYDGGITYYLKEVLTDYEQVAEMSEDAIIPNYKIPVRIRGNEDLILNDNMWKSYLLGYSYGTASFAAAYNTNVNDDYYISFNMPYDNYAARVLSELDGDSYESIRVQPVYNYYIKEYQEAIASDADYLIPNIYLYQIAADAESTGQNFDEDMMAYLTLDGELGNIMGYSTDSNVLSSLLSPTAHQMLPPAESLYEGSDLDGDSTDDIMLDRNYDLRRFLSSSYPNRTLSASSAASAFVASQHLIFDHESAGTLLNSTSKVHTDAGLWPYYTEIEMPLGRSGGTTFRDILKTRKYVERFMLDLQYFTDDRVSKEGHNIVANYSYNSGSEASDIVSSLKNSAVETHQSIDFLDFLYSSYNNIGNRSFGQGAFYAKPLTYDSKASQAIDAPYIYYNIGKNLKVVDDVISYLESNPPSIESIEDLYDLASSSKYYEVLAYRIEKAAPNGENIQNFWIFNATGLEDTITLYDSQLRYGADYVYNIYMYKLIHGIRYSLSDLVYTKQIAQPATLSDDTTAYCLQFLSAETGELAQPLYGVTAEEETEEEEEEETSTDLADYLGDSIFRDASDPYLADFMLNYEPSLKLVEIALGSKTIRILDHPAPSLDVSSYQMLDDSGVIGFSINVEAFAKTKLPTPLTTGDMQYNSNYRYHNDLLEDEKVTMPARSPTRTIEVFRLATRPTAIADFGESPFKTYDLTIQNEKGTRAVVQCHDKISTNTKYYYMFRVLNEFGIAGPLTEIYEVELVSDGGYNYMITEILFEEDLDTATYTNPTKSFGKIFQIMPHASQLTLVDSDVDYAEPSYTQIDNLEVGNADLEDKIWGKTFKLRLTSKKTGKKIDLNITYNVSSG